MKNVLFIHQSGDLYGSDKTLLFLLKYIDKTKYFPVVILPIDGPLKSALENEKIKVVIAPVLKLHRKMFTLSGLLKLFSDSKIAIKALNSLFKTYNFDIIYSNTLAVLAGIYYAKKSKTKHIWHIHEIIESPKIFAKLFSKLLQTTSNTKIIYNSFATRDFWNTTNELAQKSTVVWNGVEVVQKILSSEEQQKIRLQFFNANEDDIVIALVGRINKWKGQSLLLESFIDLSKYHSNIKLVFIGSAPANQEHFVKNLQSKIIDHKLAHMVSIVPFQENIAAFWQSIDIAVVPSTEPEPFGLVAIEAMLAKKPIVASNHGGLKEIVVDNETGFLIKPKDGKDLKVALDKLVVNKQIRKSFGEAGHNRALIEFSVESYVAKIETVLEEI